MNSSISILEFTDLIKSFGIVPRTILEIGSMDGVDAKEMKKIFPCSKVMAIEALPDNYNKYLKTLEEIETFNIIISDYDGISKFHKKNINGIHSIYNRGDNYGTKILSLPCCKLDTFCKDNNIKGLDAIKIDVEGATYEVLVGGKNVLKNVSILHIETESYQFFINQHLHKDVEKILYGLNFKCVKMTKVCHNDSNPSQAQYDSVWINKNLIKNG